MLFESEGVVLTLLLLTIFELKINAECPTRTLFYPCTCVQSVPSVTDKYFFSSINITTYDRSILCENIRTTLNLQMIFNRNYKRFGLEWKVVSTDIR
jgi:hypothetical protein